MKSYFAVLIFTFCFLLSFGQVNHLLTGNPSNAGKADSNNFLLEKKQFVLSYNLSQGKANWVSWHLNKNWTGDVDRQDNFRADPNLPEGFYRVTKSDYTNSGFDRGHYCPSKDRSSTQEDNSITFLMSNIMPQAPKNNQQTWKFLEDYCRELAEDGYEMYIIAGSYGEGGTGRNGYLKRLENGKIIVPERTWKIVLIIPDGDEDLNRINGTTPVIAVDMPNDHNIDRDWKKYLTTTRDIEQKTGYNFFSSIAQNIQDSIETRPFTFMPAKHLVNSTEEKKTQDLYYFVNAIGLNLREEASSQAKILQPLENGKRLRFVSEEGDWYRVEILNGDKAITGYVHSKFLRK